ncbi:hypothetical protein [Companilactobacillus mishanensis]|uniref:hypothetical protein n=1 Tax=Companilactobacillus mishanensis TaxID=2486008 RepID=UPI0012963833|nr:hypothetical protein [Companilactobacillus mishanensis]MQS89093.1 hypothetical protein [Companilactobacillus mishanensis]
MSQKSKKYLLLIMFLGLFLFIHKHDGLHSQNIAYADDIAVAASDVTPMAKPSRDPIKFLSIWITSGYDLQPDSKYAFVGQTKTLYTDSALSANERFWHSQARPKYSWYKTEDNGKTWNTVVENNASKRNLEVTPDKAGTVYYQQKVTWFGLFFYKHEEWSRVASITTMSNPVPAKSLEVTADDNYLFNNQQDEDKTFVHAKTNPINATGKISWKIDNSEMNLASVDKETGIVTANNKNENGTVKVIGTIQNNDGSSVSNYVKIRIGGGLDDQTATIGQTATFSVLGHKVDPDKVSWKRFYIDSNGEEKSEDVTTNNKRSLKYTTPKLSEDNLNDKYQATVYVDDEPFVTNKAKLILTPFVDEKPKFSISNTIANSTFDDHNPENTILNKVAEGDRIDLKGTLSEDNSDSELASGSLKLEIPASAELKDIKIGNQVINDYSVIVDTQNSGNQVITIPNLYFISGQPIDYDVSFFAGKYSIDKFKTNSEVIGYDSQHKELADKFSGNSIEMNFSKNAMSAVPSDIDFGTVQSIQSTEKPIEGKVDNDKSEILTVNDERRVKDKIKINLTQLCPFQCDSTDLPAELRYYSEDGSFSTLGQSEAVIEESQEGSPLNSITCCKDRGLKLIFHKNNLVSGKYKTKLCWSFSDSL